jgi:hypothetical protein
MTGDVTWTSAPFDGTANVTAVAALSASGVVAGTYNNSPTSVRPFTVDAKGRITAIGAAVAIATPASAATVPWVEVTPGGGWSNGNASNRTTLGYKNVNGVVHLKGWVTGGDTNGGFLMTLPVGSRPIGLGPTQQLELRTGGDPEQGRLFVGNDGNVFVYTLTGGTSVLTLDGLSFPINY